jgi:hypothetical protein
MASITKRDRYREPRFAATSISHHGDAVVQRLPNCQVIFMSGTVLVPRFSPHTRTTTG